MKLTLMSATFILLTIAAAAQTHASTWAGLTIGKDIGLELGGRYRWVGVGVWTPRLADDTPELRQRSGAVVAQREFDGPRYGFGGHGFLDAGRFAAYVTVGGLWQRRTVADVALDGRLFERPEGTSVESVGILLGGGMQMEVAPGWVVGLAADNLRGITITGGARWGL